MKTEKTARKDKTRKCGASLIILYLLSLIFYLVTCVQPGGSTGLSVPLDGGESSDGDDDYNSGNLPGFGDPEVTEPQISGVAIYAYPHITYFAKGQDFSYAGLVLRFIYDNGEYGRTLASAEYTVEPVDTWTLAPAVNSKPVQITITIKPTPEGDFPSVKYGIRIDSSTSILANIQMTSPPSKTAYTLGEEFSPAGVVLTGTYQGGDREGETATVSGAVVASGYNKYKRGVQSVTFMLNNTVVGQADVTVKVPSGATVTLNFWAFSTGVPQIGNLRNIQVKGRDYGAAYSNLSATVKAGGQTFILSASSGGITDGDLSGYNPAGSGNQTVTLNLDDNIKRFDVYTVDAEPEVWFDYGFRRTAADPRGTGPGAGAYYAKPGETLVLSPVRFLIGYGDDHQNTGATYSWSVVSGPSSYTKTGNGEFCSFKPTAAGTYRIRVGVSGRNYITGGNVTKYAETDVVCYTGNVGTAGKAYKPPMKDFAPGQQNEGEGYGWSLGSALGYEVWNLPTGANPLKIYGNPFSGWCEAGIVWVQYDANGNGIPDEMWYELRGSEDDDASYKHLITRRYAIRYIRAPIPAYYRPDGTNYKYDASADTEGILSWRRTDGEYILGTPVFWVDAKGRTGSMSGWPYGEGLPNEAHASATYSGTILRDNGNIDVGTYSLPSFSYVDTGPGDIYPYATFNTARDAIRADGSAANLNPALVRFVKVQTALFQYAQVFGNVSTEIVKGTDLPDQSGGFPMPDGMYE